jgi:stage III sporulation protein AA
MSPQVIIVDEIGRDDDAHAIHEAALAGIRIVASAHGHSLSDIRRRPMFRALLDSGVFQRYIVIGHRYASGTLVKAYDALGKELEHRILPFQSNQPC